ncbi:hypothetical protein [Methylobacterium flocculans]|uniref:hypothetical protein n=1 Tax=Methylobacterium flocculans TaxID=2984843 RepID=UPI0021F2A9D7|nr:hypothetical protein [Methylobacterium sp. FF17]
MFEGTWRSATGAEIRLWQFGEAVSGTYEAGPTEMPMPHRGRILVGTAEGDLIGFVTASVVPHGIKSWTGRLYPSEAGRGPEIHLMCQAIGRRVSRNAFSKSVALETVVFSLVEAEQAEDTAPP